LKGSRAEITQLASQWSSGDESAFERLIELVYDDLRRIAHHHLGMGARDTVISTTVLVHEAYVKLAGAEGATWPSRAHFFAFCSKAMRRILIDFARKRGAGKRGGDRIRVPLSEDSALIDTDVGELLAVEEALQKLEARNARMARIVECRFYGGMSVADTADALETSTRTVEREWARARAYLAHVLSDADGNSAEALD